MRGVRRTGRRLRGGGDARAGPREEALPLGLGPRRHERPDACVLNESSPVPWPRFRARQASRSLKATLPLSTSVVSDDEYHALQVVSAEFCSVLTPASA